MTTPGTPGYAQQLQDLLIICRFSQTAEVSSVGLHDWTAGRKRERV